MGSHVTPAPGSDSVLDKQPEPAGGALPQDGQRPPGAPCRDSGPAHIRHVLGRWAEPDDGTAQIAVS